MHKSQVETSIDQTGNELEAQRETLAPVAIGLLDDAPHFKRADNVFDSDAKTSQRAVMSLFFNTKFAAPRFFKA